MATPVASVMPAPATARAALRHARNVRAEHLVAVALGLLTPLEVIELAETEEGKPLRRIKLQQLLLALPHHGPTRVGVILRGLTDRLALDAAAIPDLTIGWLLDPRAAGNRLVAWLDVHQRQDAPPWPGFPLAPAPEHGGSS